jgi:hypothetical protein
MGFTGGPVPGTDDRTVSLDRLLQATVMVMVMVTVRVRITVTVTVTIRVRVRVRVTVMVRIRVMVMVRVRVMVAVTITVTVTVRVMVRIMVRAINKLNTTYQEDDMSDTNETPEAGHSLSDDRTRDLEN